MRKLGPFHATIILAINRVNSVEELNCLGQLIRDTVIPKNHTVIIAAWGERYDHFFPNTTGEPRDVDAVLQNLLSESEYVTKYEKKKEGDSETSPLTSRSPGFVFQE